MLGLQLGRLPSELAVQMMAAEETMLMAYYRADPWGDHRADIRAAQVTQMVHNTQSKKPRELQDFLLFTGRKEKPKGDSPNQIRKNFERLMARQKR